jgi:hypothetical protein
MVGLRGYPRDRDQTFNRLRMASKLDVQYVEGVKGLAECEIASVLSERGTVSIRVL